MIRVLLAVLPPPTSGAPSSTFATHAAAVMPNHLLGASTPLERTFPYWLQHHQGRDFQEKIGVIKTNVRVGTREANRRMGHPCSSQRVHTKSNQNSCTSFTFDSKSTR
jgi:hypothetical protein